MVRKPTPEAVLDAVRLLATPDDADDEPDGVVVVDVGGATTDVHSAMAVDDRPAYITATGLPSLPVTRSVQGDLGMRWGAESVVDGRPRLAAFGTRCRRRRPRRGGAAAAAATGLAAAPTMPSSGPTMRSPSAASTSPCSGTAARCRRTTSPARERSSSSAGWICARRPCSSARVARWSAVPAPSGCSPAPLDRRQPGLTRPAGAADRRRPLRTSSPPPACCRRTTGDAARGLLDHLRRDLHAHRSR